MVNDNVNYEFGKHKKEDKVGLTESLYLVYFLSLIALWTLT